MKSFTEQMGSRLAKVRAETGQSVTGFAMMLSVTPESYASYEDGTAEMPFAFLRRLHEIHDVNPAWLMAGEGDKYDAA